MTSGSLFLLRGDELAQFFFAQFRNDGLLSGAVVGHEEFELLDSLLHFLGRHQALEQHLKRPVFIGCTAGWWQALGVTQYNNVTAIHTKRHTGTQRQADVFTFDFDSQVFILREQFQQLFWFLLQKLW